MEIKNGQYTGVQDMNISLVIQRKNFLIFIILNFLDLINTLYLFNLSPKIEEGNFILNYSLQYGIFWFILMKFLIVATVIYGLLHMEKINPYLSMMITRSGIFIFLFVVIYEIALEFLLIY